MTNTYEKGFCRLPHTMSRMVVIKYVGYGWLTLKEVTEMKDILVADFPAINVARIEICKDKDANWYLEAWVNDPIPETYTELLMLPA